MGAFKNMATDRNDGIDADQLGSLYVTLSNYWDTLIDDLGKLDPVRANHFGLTMGLLLKVYEGGLTEEDIKQIDKFDWYLQLRSKS